MLLRDRLHALAEQRRRFGYRRFAILPRREGHAVNAKRVYRLYGEGGLAVRRRRRKRLPRLVVLRRPPARARPGLRVRDSCEDLLFEVTDWTIVTAVRRWLDRWLTFTRRHSFRRRHSLAKLETMIKEAIARGARRQVRVVVTPLRREVVRLRRKVTDLQATVTTLRRSAVGWKRLMEAAPAIPQVSEEDAKAARLSPRLIESLRRRLGLSQMALARLVGVSATAVAHWAAGDSMPTGQNRMTLVALRRVGKREAKELLARRVKETVSLRRRTRKRPARRPRKRLER